VSASHDGGHVRCYPAERASDNRIEARIAPRELPAARGPDTLASMPKPLPIDRCQHLIRLLGRTWGHFGPEDERGTGYWLICSRDGDEIVVRGDTMEATWNEALRLAGRVQREQALPVDA